MLDWNNIIAFEKLYKAHRIARLDKRHKKEVVLFEANLNKNLKSPYLSRVEIGRNRLIRFLTRQSPCLMQGD